jgi:hypothetical protein
VGFVLSSTRAAPVPRRRWKSMSSPVFLALVAASAAAALFDLASVAPDL